MNRNWVKRVFYTQLAQQYRRRLIREKLSVWLFAAVGFVALLFFGAVVQEQNGQSETILFRDYAKKIFYDFTLTLYLVLPTLILVLTVSWILLRYRQKMPTNRLHKLFSWFTILIPTILSAIPIFILGIYSILLFRLDTLESYNFIAGWLCLAAFNLNYYYQRSYQSLQEAQRQPSVLYARCLGIPEAITFRQYILPNIVKEQMAMVRELLPHIFVESIIVEYTFSYNAFLRTMIQAVQYQNWHYLALSLYLLILFISAANIVLSWIESLFDIESK